VYHLRADHHPDYVPALARCSTPEKRLIVSADEKLTAFLELERVTQDDTPQNQNRKRQWLRSSERSSG
jgi:hypothetical protein